MFKACGTLGRDRISIFEQLAELLHLNVQDLADQLKEERRKYVLFLRVLGSKQSGIDVSEEAWRQPLKAA
jgi:hypothetical protein